MDLSGDCSSGLNGSDLRRGVGLDWNIPGEDMEALKWEMTLIRMQRVCDHTTLHHRLT